MGRVLVKCHDLELFELSKKALQGQHEVVLLREDTAMMETLSKNPADLVLIMLSEADTSGYRIFHMIKKIPELKGKPIVFLMSHFNDVLERKVMSLGVNDIISMPVTNELLLLKINACLELAQLRTEKPYVEKYQDAISFCFAELVECRDVITGGHLKNTTRYFKILLQEAMASDYYKNMISKDDEKDILRSATLHDIGKIGISDDILRKESSLDYNEFEFMKTHTTLGRQAFEKIIKETGGAKWLYLAKDMAYCHHERWDGTGYPDGLKGEEIPLYARMLTIADVYDALTSNRAYKKAYSHKRAVDIIAEGKGSFFDPMLVDLFIKANKRFEETLLKKRQSPEK
jgi:Response regulator containing a CheY-like receiver domain and an HD-GYP domain